MGYTPYKMVGHELKGPNQRKSTVAKMNAFGTKDSDMPDKVSTTPGMPYAEGGVGSSPAKGIWDKLKRVGKGILTGGISEIVRAKKKKAEAAAAAAETGAAAAVDPAAAGGDGSDHTHPEFAQLDAAAQGGGPQEAETAMTKQQNKVSKNPWMAQGGVGNAATAASNAATTMFSDIRLKEKIQKTGKSPSGIPIYEFNYIGGNSRYSGAMAQDLLSMGIDAVSVHESGYYQVNYNNIDVDMHQIN